jgi:hypothetical protein
LVFLEPTYPVPPLFRKDSKVDQLAFLADWAVVLVPALAIWAVLGAHSRRYADYRTLCDCLYFALMLIIAGLTLRTMSANDPCWLIHTASLGAMVVGGVVSYRDSSEESTAFTAG